jgi:hypothetical protein
MKTTSRTTRQDRILILLMFFLGPSVLFGEPLIEHTFHSSRPDRDIEEVLYLAAGVALVEAGYSSVRGVPDLQVQQVYRLEHIYVVQDNMLTVDYRVRSFDGEELAATEFTTELNVYLDRNVSAAMEYLIDAAGMTARDSPNARIYSFGTAPAAVEDETSEEGPSEDERSISERPVEPALPEPRVEPPLKPPAVPAGTHVPTAGLPLPGLPVPFVEPSLETASVPTKELPPTMPLPLPEIPDSVTESPEPPTATRTPDPDGGVSPGEAGKAGSGRHLSVGGGAMFITGEGAALFRNSIFGRATAEYTPKRTGMKLTYGGAGTVHRVYANENVSGGNLYVSTLGPSFGFKLGPDGAVDIRAVVSAGPAIISVRGNGDELTKTVAFVEVSTAVNVPVHRTIGIGLSLGWLSVLEGDMVLQGLTTSLVARFSL